MFVGDSASEVVKIVKINEVFSGDDKISFGAQEISGYQDFLTFLKHFCDTCQRQYHYEFNTVF